VDHVIAFVQNVFNNDSIIFTFYLFIYLFFLPQTQTPQIIYGPIFMFLYSFEN